MTVAIAAKRKEISLPAHDWMPRDDQRPVWDYLERGGLRVDLVAHRRWGKDEVSLNWAAAASHQRVGNYWHMLPEQQQAKKAIWDAVDPGSGMRRIDKAFPKALRARTVEDEMMITFKNGSTWQVIGSDAYDRLVGTTPIGVVFSEWSLSKPAAWAYVRPILLQNKGWAVFIWTPRGKNHATRAYEVHAKDPKWYTQKIDARHSPVFTEEELAGELADYIAEAGSAEEGEARFDQEYMVSFDAPVPGAYYGVQMRSARAGTIMRLDAITGKPLIDPITMRLCPSMQGTPRVGYFPFIKGYPVETAWDLGMDDYTAIWFFQRVGRRIRIIDYYETSGQGFDAIKQEAFDDPDRSYYRYFAHHLPHDVAVRELGAGGRSRKQSLEELGISPIRVGTKHNLDEGVAAVRKIFQSVDWNEERASVGIEHVTAYAKKFNAALGMFTGEDHNEHSHAADALREIAYNVRLKDMKIVEPVKRVVDRWAKTFASARTMAAGANWKTT